MATDFGDGPSPEGPSGTDYSLSATGIVSRTLGLWTRKLLPYIIMMGGIMVIYSIVEAVAGFYILGDQWTGILPSDFQSYFTQLVYWVLYPAEVIEGIGVLMMLSTVFLIISLIVLAVVIGATIKYTLDLYTAGGEDIGSSLSFSFSRFVPMIIVIAIINLLFGLLLAPGAAISQRALELVDPTDIYSFAGLEELINGALLTLGLSIPLLYIAVRLAPVFVVVIAEDVSPAEALSRAFRMTSGNFMHVFASWALIFIVNFVITFIIDLFVGALLGFGALSSVVYTLIVLLITSPITYIFFTVLYKDLESRSGASASLQAYW